MRDVCLVGDCRDSMRALIAAGVRVQMCVTSPPYWGLRDYGTATWEGGEDGCDHSQYRSIGASTLRSDGRERIGTQDYEKTAATVVPYRDLCGKCGARRIDSQLGLEATPEEYVANMVEVFRLVRELLAEDGTLWLNLGDSYFGSATSGGAGTSNLNEPVESFIARAAALPRKVGAGLKPKDLVGIPWRVAFALQADGWYLRSDIIWSKPNPMPESVTDRPTKAHEYLFLLSKRERYFYDAEAIRESAEYGYSEATRGSMWSKVGSIDADPKRGNYTVVPGNGGTRNRRTVWTVATEPYSEAHFATFPTALIEPCILAGSRVGDTVFDPFLGSGTVGQVAQNLGRHWLGCELNPAYVPLQAARTAQLGLALTA